MPLSDTELDAITLTLALASVTTVILLLVGTPLAWWLSRRSGSKVAMIEALVAVPLILPPTVLGFYLLILFAPDTGLGQFWQRLTGSQLAFSFSALVIGSVMYSLPFVVQPLQQPSSASRTALLQAAATLGATPLDQFRSVVIPLTRRSFLIAASLGFAHTVGEFGVVLMIGGNIPGETQVLVHRPLRLRRVTAVCRGPSLAGGLVVFSLVAAVLALPRTDHSSWRLRS